jgi:hypothetical protein
MATQKTTYEEVGTVIEEYIPMKMSPQGLPVKTRISLIGNKVYFDSWLAKKFPVKGKPGEFVWFVKYEDLVAYEPVSE